MQQDVTVMTFDEKTHATTIVKPPFVLTTARLQLREVNTTDAADICLLLNDAAFLQFIGDRHVRTELDAQDYIRRVLLQSYQCNGFGLWHISWRQTEVSIAKPLDASEPATPHVGENMMLGLCGLVKRDGLEDVDLGYALLPHARGQGVVQEAASAVLCYARQIGLPRLAAIVRPDNLASVKTLQHLGFKPYGNLRLPDSHQDLAYYLLELALTKA
jgi:RimJ/RimL family protein N-acetyltransferase